jgi:hypothetical protein
MASSGTPRLRATSAATLALLRGYATWNGSEPVDYIVVLGGGYTYNRQWAPSSNLLNPAR